MSDIFISYTRRDQPAARKLADALERKGWSVWWDPKLRTGEHFDDVIEQALTEARCVIVLWSQRSVQSRYVKDEAAYALQRNKLFPVAIDEVALPFRYEGIHTPRLIDWDGLDVFPAFQTLVADIKAVLGSSPAEAEVKREVEFKQKEEWRDPVTGMEFAWVPGGCFQMGSNEGDPNEKPVHEVCVDGFWMGKYEVTQGQLKLVMGNNPSLFKGSDNHPVESVSWPTLSKRIISC